MVDRNDVIDLLAIISTIDNRQVTDADIIVWHEHLERYERDECLDAIMAHQQQSSAWLQPVHVVERVRATRNDRIERADPDDRPHLVGLNGAKRDRYRFIDKSAPDEEDYPKEWTSEQCLKASWEKIQRMRDQQAKSGDPLVPHMPASAVVRAQSMEHIRSVLRH